MKVLIARVVVIALLMITESHSAEAHGGGLDRNGCHTNRKTGDYHCHGAPASARSAAAAPRNSSPIIPAAQRVSPSRVTVDSPATTPATDLVRAAQVLLRALGYAPSILGANDSRTDAAIRAFQRTQGLEPTGVVSEYLVLRLAEAVSARCK
jgi:murein L,D-transpeptidase YcbB/YkuD